MKQKGEVMENIIADLEAWLEVYEHNHKIHSSNEGGVIKEDELEQARFEKFYGARIRLAIGALTTEVYF